MMEAASAWTASHGTRATVVGVAHSNDGAIRFYERHGFRPFYVLMFGGPRQGASTAVCSSRTSSARSSASRPASSAS